MRIHNDNMHPCTNASGFSDLSLSLIAGRGRQPQPVLTSQVLPKSLGQAFGEALSPAEYLRLDASALVFMRGKASFFFLLSLIKSDLYYDTAGKRA